MDRLIYSSAAVEYIRFNNKNIQNIIANKIKIPMRKLQKKWCQLPYPGEKGPPKGIDPTAGSWPLFFMKRSRNGRFIGIDGKVIRFAIQHPNNIDFCNELSVVRKTLNEITRHQKEIAEYWGDGPATKQWTPIIDRLLDTYNLSPAHAARVLAVVQAAINDAFAITWHYKYLWNIPRPIQLDQKLITVICTPIFPAYPSGHSVISGTAEVILSYFFPTEAGQVKKLAEENSISRLYGGVHFPSDLREGLRLGRQIGRLIVDSIKCQRDGNNHPVDVPSIHDLRANLNPPPYHQVIPYPSRVRLCDFPLVPLDFKDNNPI